DNAIAIDFSGDATGSVSITSNAAVILAGPITNPDGTTSITATQGSITSQPGGSIDSHDLTLSAVNGNIGSSRQPLAPAQEGGSLSAAANKQGIYLNLSTAANLGSITAGSSANGYGDVVINANGDLERSGTGTTIGTGVVTGNNITLTSSTGYIGLASAL